MLALELFALDPVGLAGLWVRARSGPVRDRFLQHVRAVRFPLPLVKIPPGSDDAVLYGGFDWSSALSDGRLMERPGLLSRPSVLLLPMAEQCAAGLSARLGQALDRGDCAVIALDEGEDGLSGALSDRLGIYIDLEGVSWRDCTLAPRLGEGLKHPILESVRLTGQDLEHLTVLAARLGIPSLRAPLLAARAARAHAGIQGRTEVCEEDLAVGAGLVLAHRALSLEVPPDEPEDQPTPEPEAADRPAQDRDIEDLSQQELLLEAVKAALPRDVLERLASERAARRAKGAAGSGAARHGNRRGRPLPSRPGQLGSGARIDLISTLRAAAPWQRMRKALSPGRDGILFRASDIRIKRYEEKSDRLLIFAVDASGSAAASRLAEAKGAVELLLAEAYARRDHVALIAFRRQEAELLLPPTRSLVQTKRRLAALPGGGGTPMAAGLQAAAALAELERLRGMTPTIAVLSDGRANIALDGSADRAAARSDAIHIARRIAHAGTAALMIDTAPRPQPALQELSAQMGAWYLPLPRAQSQRLSQQISSAMAG